MKSAEQKAKNVPAIRFAVFDDAWVEKKIFDVAEIVGGGTPSTANPQFWDGNIDWYAPAEINDQVFVNGSERKITKLGLENSSAKVLPANRTVLFTSRAGIGKTAILQSPAATNQGFQSLVLNDDTDTYFVYSMTDKIKAKAERIASGSTFAEISGKMLGNLELVFPSKKEQSKIGSFFSNIDSLISLEQKKYDKLTQVKKSMLEKMFPKEGATVPEIRFAGFTGDWVIQNLNNICSIITKQTGFDYSETIKPSLFTDKIDNTYSFIQNKDFEGLNINLDTDFYIPVKIAEKFPKITLDQPSLLISISGRIGNVGLFSLDTKAFIGGAVGICKLNNVEDGKIALFELQSPTGQLYFKSLIKASSHANITVEDIRQIVVTIPKEECEKKKINQYFSHLDSLISLQQRKLEKLKNIKKSLLEKMFV